MTSVDGSKVGTTKGDQKTICGATVHCIPVRKGRDL